MKVFEVEKLAIAQQYVEERGWEKHGQTAPTRAGLAVILDIAKDTLFRWAERYDDWRALLNKMDAHLELELNERALSGNMSAAMTKVMLERMLGSEGERRLEARKQAALPKRENQESNIVDIDDYDKLITGH